MLQTFLSGTILSIEEKVSEDGQPIVHGRYQFIASEARGDKEEIRDELEFRCKGAPAVAIKETGIGGTGVAQGYLDMKLVQMEGYREKIPTLVIRVWDSTSIITPNPFDEADAQLAQMEAVAKTSYNPENAPRPAPTYSF